MWRTSTPLPLIVSFAKQRLSARRLRSCMPILVMNKRMTSPRQRVQTLILKLFPVGFWQSAKILFVRTAEGYKPRPDYTTDRAQCGEASLLASTLPRRGFGAGAISITCAERANHSRPSQWLTISTLLQPDQ